ncbi:MAG: TrkH family potassium uptake protein [Myxococcales bacterium]|nr:TrkH family potassium uptake protein [Myxococcales bacterium]MDD9970832.1 TrkH family potassium uptake protein [Myxococcales bacterium]
MRVTLVFGVVGQLLRRFSVAFIPPLLLGVVDEQWDLAGHFVVAALATYIIGTLAGLRFSTAPVFHRAEALAVVAFTWLSVAVFGAIPYALQGLSFVDAVFESMSGLTTTGATVFTRFERYGRALFLWRAMSQWFGGLGVIALFVVVLPRLGIAGRQLFFAEASGAPSEAISPQVRDSANRLWILYTALTTLLAGLLLLTGMPPYESVLHALTTMSAGGFSPNPQSISGYHNAAAEWVLVVFMLLSGTSFTLQYKVFTGRPFGFFRDGEFVFYLSVTLVGALGVACVLARGTPELSHLRVAAFQATSLVSSTGFASVDYDRWSDSARAILITLMVLGGCAGSAAGGPKAIRFVLVLKRMQREITRVLHPRAVLPLRYKKRPIPDEIVRAVYSLVVLYLAGYFLLGVVLVLLGSDLVTGFSAALACLGNIGPAFGPAGPMGSFAHFSDLAKSVLVFAMWIGRLEIVAVLALLHSDVWRAIRWQD